MASGSGERKWRYRLVIAVGISMVVAAVMVLPGVMAADRQREAAGSVGTPWAVDGEPGGQALTERQLQGLFTEDVITHLRAKYPPSEWPWVRNIRLFVNWNSIESKRKGKFDWSDLDAQINAALDLGLNSIMLTISSPVPEWATNWNNPWNPQNGPPLDNADFGDFCGAVASRYKDYVDYYQIWQEPGWDIDAPPFLESNWIYYCGQCDFSYMGVLRAAYQGIKANDPDSYVASGSLLNGLTREPESFKNYEILLAGGNQDFSMKVESDRNIVAERPMYFNYKDEWPGGSDQLGVEAPQKEWYLAEGATHPGFEEWICIQNPGGADADVTVTYMFSGGATQIQNVTVGAHSRYTIDVNGTVGLYKDVSARLESTEPIVVERPMYFNYHDEITGGSIEAGVNQLSDTWFLAEGATQPGFEEWISLMNPSTEYVDIDITYMIEGEGTQTQQFQMPPTSRDTVLVNGVIGANKNVSAKVEATGQIIVERPMYFIYQDKWSGGHSQVGATEEATSWFLSEGTTRDNQYDGSFDEWISIQNAGDNVAHVDITYMFTEGGVQTGSIDVPAHSRETILVNDIIGSNRDVSVQLDSDEPIVVERPMYFNYHNELPGGTVELGCRNTSQTWYFAEGTTRIGFEEWLTLQNPQTQEAHTTITFMFNDGTTQEKTVTLPPNSRTTVNVNNSVSMATICDGVAVHPYDYPQWWAWYYQYVVDICNKNGYGDLEVICSEIGWPNGTNSAFSEEGQREAIGEVGVGGLRAAGCKKIWIFQAVDTAPGQSQGGDYYGLYDYYGNPHPAWNEYKNWQTVLPDYGNKPGHL